VIPTDAQVSVEDRRELDELVALLERRLDTVQRTRAAVESALSRARVARDALVEADVAGGPFCRDFLH
jgi:hypothetical protein